MNFFEWQERKNTHARPLDGYEMRSQVLPAEEFSPRAEDLIEFPAIIVDEQSLSDEEILELKLAHGVAV